MHTFGQHLLQFCRAIDLVDLNLRDRIASHAFEYVKDKLGIGFLEFLIETRVNNQTGLDTRWCRGGPDAGATSLLLNGSPYGQSARAFIDNKPMWITAKNDRPLDAPDAAYIDHWSEVPSKKIPRYFAVNRKKALTSIIIPISQGDDVHGVVNFEAEKQVSITDAAKRELKDIVDALSTIDILYSSHVLQAEGTAAAMDALDRFRKTIPIDFRIPSVFVAFSSRADVDVLSVVKAALEPFKDKINPIWWNEKQKPGDIGSQIVKAITGCTFGICYLCEPDRTHDSGYSYRYNENVLFESGMLHSLTQVRTQIGKPIGWIPIREKDGPPLPFDLGTQRTITVPRRGEGPLKFNGRRSVVKPRLEEEVVKHIKAMLQEILAMDAPDE